jgi:hypothetical protein
MLGNNLPGGDIECRKQGRCCRAACNRGSGRSRRVRSGASSSLVPAPTPGSMAFRLHKGHSPLPTD